VSSLPIVTVVGATGEQGGSVVHALLATNHFKVRAVARNPSGKAAEALAAKNVEVFRGDYDDPPSLVAAFKGSFGAFLVTTIWNPFSGVPDTNYNQGKTLVDAANEAGVEFIVWSTMHDFDLVTHGEYSLPGFTNKNKVEQYIKGLGLSAAFVSPGFDMSNWVDVPIMGAPARKEDGRVVYETVYRADVGLPLIDINDFGKFVAPLFKDSKRYNGARILASAEYMTTEQMAAAYTKATGESVSVVLKDPHSLPHVMITDSALGVSRYGYYGGEPLQDSHRLYDDLQLGTLEEWIRRTGYKAKAM
jgi:uncharacterized protein YbjT (DUF2867 family)